MTSPDRSSVSQGAPYDDRDYDQIPFSVAGGSGLAVDLTAIAPAGFGIRIDDLKVSNVTGASGTTFTIQAQAASGLSSTNFPTPVVVDGPTWVGGAGSTWQAQNDRQKWNCSAGYKLQIVVNPVGGVASASGKYRFVKGSG